MLRKVQISWDITTRQLMFSKVMPVIPVPKIQTFLDCLTLKMEALRYFETPVNIPANTAIISQKN
jgi:hypothetical protein